MRSLRANRQARLRALLRAAWAFVASPGRHGDLLEVGINGRRVRVWRVDLERELLFVYGPRDVVATPIAVSRRSLAHLHGPRT